MNPDRGTLTRPGAGRPRLRGRRDRGDQRFRVMGDQQEVFRLVASVSTAWRTLDEIARLGRPAKPRLAPRESSRLALGTRPRRRAIAVGERFIRSACAAAVAVSLISVLTCADGRSPAVSIKVGTTWLSAIHSLRDKARLRSVRPWGRFITSWLATGAGQLGGRSMAVPGSRKHFGPSRCRDRQKGVHG
jgi:hypothetical protein